MFLLAREGNTRPVSAGPFGTFRLRHSARVTPAAATDPALASVLTIDPPREQLFGSDKVLTAAFRAT